MNIKRIFVDMDGVLADFNDRVSEWFDVENPYMTDPETHKGDGHLPKILGLSWGTFWPKLNSVAFWQHIPPMPDWENIISLAEETVGRESVFILSSPGNPSVVQKSCEGKARWLLKYLPEYANSRRYMFTNQKFLCAKPGTVLLDDYAKYADRFTEEGGTGVLVPRIWNRNHELETLPYIESALST